MTNNPDLGFLQSIQDHDFAAQDPSSNLGELPKELTQIRRVTFYNRLKAAYMIDGLMRGLFYQAKKRPGNSGVAERLYLGLPTWALTRYRLGRKEEAQIAVSTALEWACVQSSTRAHVLETAVAVDACPGSELPRLAEVIELFRKSEHEPAAFSALLQLSKWLTRQERFSKATECLNAAQDLVETAQPVRLLQVHLQRLNLAVESGHPEKAQELLDVFPPDLLAGYPLPYMYFWCRAEARIAAARGDLLHAFDRHAEAAVIALSACGAEALLDQLEAAGACRPASIADEDDRVQVLLAAVSKLQDLGKMSKGGQRLPTRPLTKYLRGKSAPKDAVDFDQLRQGVQELQLIALDSGEGGRRKKPGPTYPGGEPTEEMRRPSPKELFRAEVGPSPAEQRLAEQEDEDSYRTEEISL